MPSAGRWKSSGAKRFVAQHPSSLACGRAEVSSSEFPFTEWFFFPLPNTQTSFKHFSSGLFPFFFLHGKPVAEESTACPSIVLRFAWKRQVRLSFVTSSLIYSLLKKDRFGSGNKTTRSRSKKMEDIELI